MLNVKREVTLNAEPSVALMMMELLERLTKLEMGECDEKLTWAVKFIFV